MYFKRNHLNSVVIGGWEIHTIVQRWESVNPDAVRVGGGGVQRLLGALCGRGVYV